MTSIIQKVLIAAPIAGHKQETLANWLQWCSEQELQDVDIMLVPNGRHATWLYENIVKTEFPKGSSVRKMWCEPLPYQENRSVFDWISIAREHIRVRAIEENYDWILWLDSDTIPVTKTALKDLIDVAKFHKIASVCGLYFYKNTQQPVYAASWGSNPSFNQCVLFAEKGWLMPMGGGGLGCCLQHKSAFTAASFLLADLERDTHGNHTTSTEDFPYFYSLSMRGIESWLWCRVVCRHIGNYAIRTPPEHGSSISIYAATPSTKGGQDAEEKSGGTKQKRTPETRRKDSVGNDADVHDKRRDKDDSGAKHNDQQSPS